MALEFGTAEWAQALVEAINASSEYRNSGRSCRHSWAAAVLSSYHAFWRTTAGATGSTFDVLAGRPKN